MVGISGKEELGRSMVEMLGVLAIVGVLSIGGISGYSKAMAKHKVNKTLDQVSMLVTNIHSTYGIQNSYAGLDNKAAITGEIADLDMSHGTSKLSSPYGADVTIQAVDDGLSFTITYNKIPKGACASLTSSNWGEAASGLVSIKIGEKEHVWSSNDETLKLPITFGIAALHCSSDNDNTIVWKYH